jgi:hypothetical protein
MMPNEREVSDEVKESFSDVGEVGRALQVGVGDAGQLGDPNGQLPSGVDELAETIKSASRQVGKSASLDL